MDNILPALVLIAIVVGDGICSDHRLSRHPLPRGKPKVVRGHLNESSLRAIDDICQQSGVQLGSITALPSANARSD